MFLLNLITFLDLLSQTVAVPTKRDAITSCLTEAKVPIDTKDSTTWKQDGTAYNLRLPYEPVAIAVPTTTAQIAAAVKCGAKHSVQIAAKSGGHSYASFGLGGSDGHLVVELDRMYSVKLNKNDNTAVIQPGARLGHVATELYNQGKRAISHGTCPGVGLGGHALHGGYGLVSRKHGLALDWIKSATVVLADGSVVKCSATQRPGLFFAIRGAGSAFGIVAEFEFNTFAAPDTMTDFTISLSWSSSDAIVSGIETIQAFAKSMPAEISMQIGVSKGSYSIDGAYVGSADALKKAIQPLLTKLGSSAQFSSTGVDWLQFITHFAGSDDINLTTASYSAHDTFYASSVVVPEMSTKQIQSFVKYVTTTGASSSHAWWLQMDFIGGSESAVSKPKTDATAFVHRDKLLLFQLYDSVSQGSQYPSDGFTLIKGFRDSITSGLSSDKWGMYVNYADSQLTDDNGPQLYWGSNLAKLQDIKAGYDAKNLFKNPQSIKPVSLSK